MTPFWMLTVICWMVGHDDVTVTQLGVSDHVVTTTGTRRVCARCRRSA